MKLKGITLNKSGRLLLSFSITIGFFAINCSHSKPYIAHSIKSFGSKPVVSETEIRTRVILIGDAGEPHTSTTLLDILETWASKIPEKTTIVFLGDNIYPYGIPEKNRSEAETRLKKLMYVPLRSKAKAIFIPGNHDWDHGNKEAILRQEQMVTRTLGDSSFLPQNACPGPSLVIKNGVNFIVFDSQYFLLKGKSVDPNCKHKNIQSFASSIKEIINQANSPTILLTHHPLTTHGPHGGFRSWKNHLFPLTAVNEYLWIPLPVFGSIYYGIRYLLPSNQNVRGKRYKQYIDATEEAVRGYKGPKKLIYAGGHDHSLQIIEHKDLNLVTIVSGAGSKSKITTVSNNEETIFAHEHSGFMVLDFLENGSAILQIIEDPEENPLFIYKIY